MDQGGGRSLIVSLDKGLMASCHGHCKNDLQTKVTSVSCVCTFANCPIVVMLLLDVFGVSAYCVGVCRIKYFTERKFS